MPYFPGLPGNVVRTLGPAIGDDDAIAVWSGANSLEARDFSSGGFFSANEVSGLGFTFVSPIVTAPRLLALRDMGGVLAFLDDIVRLHEGL